MKTTRRRFLQTTATAMAATIVAPHVLGGPRHVAPSDKVNVALVGAGGQGRTNMRALFREPDAQVIAVADPIEQFSLEAFYYKGPAGARRCARRSRSTMPTRHPTSAVPRTRTFA